MVFLRKLWAAISGLAATVNGPGIVHEDLTLVMRTLRELSSTTIERVRIDSDETFKRVCDFTGRFQPEMNPRIELYTDEGPIFELYGVEDEIQKALHRKVQLKSGGHIVIDQTEAMTTVDVNTGGFVGHRNFDETIFKTNLEAAQTIARQLRLRNLGGIIIIDFIDMSNETHRRQVSRALEKALARDHTRTHISDVSPLGLVEMTRKRTRESLEHLLCDPCPTCRARGSIKSADTVCYEIFREILREARQFDTERLLVIASPEVSDRLVDEESSAFAELEGAHREAHHAAGREPVLAGTVRRRADVTGSHLRRPRPPPRTAAGGSTPVSVHGLPPLAERRRGRSVEPGTRQRSRRGAHPRTSASGRPVNASRGQPRRPFGRGLLRLCACTLAGLALLGAATLAGLRVLLPEIERYRPEVEAWLSRIADRRVEFGAIDAYWRGWTPVFRIRDVRIVGDEAAAGGSEDRSIRLADLRFSIDPARAAPVRRAAATRDRRRRRVDRHRAAVRWDVRARGARGVRGSRAGRAFGEQPSRAVDAESGESLAARVAHPLDRRTVRRPPAVARRRDAASGAHRRPVPHLRLVRTSRGRPGRLRSGRGRRSSRPLMDRRGIRRRPRRRCRPPRPPCPLARGGGGLRGHLRQGVEHLDRRPARRGRGYDPRALAGRHAGGRPAGARRG